MTKKKNNTSYLGNTNLKAAGVKVDFTKKQVEEYLKCSKDPVYFIKTYIKIVSLDEGLVPFDMWDFQEDIIEKVHNNRFVIAKLPRQTGKSTTMISYLLHYVLFNQDVNVAILANKLATAMFEATKAAGTNILVANGPVAGQTAPHVIVNIIPRFEGDKIAIGWQPTKADDAELESLAEKIKNAMPKTDSPTIKEIVEEDLPTEAKRIP